MEVRDLSLVTLRKPLEEVEPIKAIRWLLRLYFGWRGFACRSHTCNGDSPRHKGQPCDGKCYASIEYLGVFDDGSLAHWAASCNGGAVKPIPFNVILPRETVSYKPEVVPMSEAASWYRRGVMMPFEAVHRSQIKRLNKSLTRNK